MFYRISIYTIVLLFFFGCKKIDPYEGFRAYYFGDYLKAFEIYLEACKEDNDAFMCHSIGGMFENGNAIARDYKKAYKYYILACENGIPQACSAASRMHREGRVRYDPDKMSELYLRACDLELASGCYSAGALYYNRYSKGNLKEDAEKSRELIKKLFGKACDLGDQKGCSVYKTLQGAGY